VPVKIDYLCCMKIGKTTRLKAKEKTDSGFYLTDDTGDEVLLPGSYCPESLRPGDEIDVFVYKDSSDRPVAVTSKPLAEAGEFAWMQVSEVNRFGAFVDWGLPKELLVPFAEQHQKLTAGNSYLIYVKLDNVTDRLVGSAKLNKYFDDDPSGLKEGQEVELLFYQKTELGFKALVNGKYNGLLFSSDAHRQIRLGESYRGFVKTVRTDGKLDVMLEPCGYENSIDDHVARLLAAIKKANGFLPLHDKSDAAEIKAELGLSKKAFKKAVGKLLKQGVIEKSDQGISLSKMA